MQNSAEKVKNFFLSAKKVRKIFQAVDFLKKSKFGRKHLKTCLVRIFFFRPKSAEFTPNRTTSAEFALFLCPCPPLYMTCDFYLGEECNRINTILNRYVYGL